MSRLSLWLLLPLIARPCIGAPLVDAAWLATHQHDSNLRILEVSTGHEGIGDRHIPGAIVTHFPDDGWTTRYQEVPGLLPDTPSLTQLVRRLGIANNDRVIVVARGTGVRPAAAATRIFWTLRILGQEQLSLLDGGLPAYLAAGGEWSANLRKPASTHFTARFQEQLIVNDDGVYLGDDYGNALIDLRPREYFTGETGNPHAKRHGSLHGAVNITAEVLLDPVSGRFLSPEALHARFSEVAPSHFGPVIVFSDIGLRASLGWFVLKEILGYRDVRLYDGGFVAWQANGSNEVRDLTDDMGGVIGG